MVISLNPEQSRVVDLAVEVGVISSANEAIEAGLESIRKRLEDRPVPPISSAAEWSQELRAWANNYPTDAPLLSDEAVDRESIYGDRGL